MTQRALGAASGRTVGDRAHAIVGACSLMASELTGARSVAAAVEPTLSLLGEASGADRVEFEVAGERWLIGPASWGTGHPGGNPR